ncbi:MAG: ferredoxin [Nanoarchaeota archaeon]|nr:ferredoxin [Nanoarchaeota archaeon]|tara:strand:- start:1301 stop:1588 length:288 start_codon:yes stop_codon:yes gene_type:complete
MEEISVKYKRHIFVCVRERKDSECCSEKNSEEIFLKLRNHVNENGLMHTFNVSKSLCLGHCNEGPTIAIYPDGKILRKVSLEDIDKIIEEYLNNA